MLTGERQQTGDVGPIAAERRFESLQSNGGVLRFRVRLGVPKPCSNGPDRCCP